MPLALKRRSPAAAPPTALRRGREGARKLGKYREYSGHSDRRVRQRAGPSNAIAGRTSRRLTGVSGGSGAGRGAELQYGSPPQSPTATIAYGMIQRCAASGLAFRTAVTSRALPVCDASYAARWRVAQGNQESPLQIRPDRNSAARGSGLPVGLSLRQRGVYGRNPSFVPFLNSLPISGSRSGQRSGSS